MSVAALARKDGAARSQAHPRAALEANRARPAALDHARGEHETARGNDPAIGAAPPQHHWSLMSMGMDAPQASESARGVVPMTVAASRLREADERRTATYRAHGPMRFRVPTTSDLKALIASGNVPEAVLKDRVETALTRMSEENRLKTAEPVADLMKKIFPPTGGFDEAAYEAAVDVTDRKRVYQSITDAEAKVKATDKPKLKTVMDDSAKLIGECAADKDNLKSVFGSKAHVAKDVYVMARVALNTAVGHIDSAITVDYNMDDPEVGLGGWATFSNQHVHFTASVAQVTNENEAKVTIIHESCHLANPAVDDKGYYGSGGFESVDENTKITNAAHYEEIPRRKLGISKYTDPSDPKKFIDFKPGIAASGAPQGFEDKVRRKSSEYLRKAWDEAVNIFGLIRDVRKAQVAGNSKPFKENQKRLIEISKLMNLTIHEQSPATASVNQIDVVLAEGVARAAAKAHKIGKTLKVPGHLTLTMPEYERFKPRRLSVFEQKLQLQPIPGLDPSAANVPVLYSEDEAAEKVIDESIREAGTISGDSTKDKKLMDWLVAEDEKL
jgi:hypothetical protein